MVGLHFIYTENKYIQTQVFLNVKSGTGVDEISARSFDIAYRTTSV